jgi:hypothetical protein
MVFNTTFNNISAISWQSALEKTTDLPQVTDKLYHIMLYSLPWAGVEPTTSVVIGTDCIGSCKSNYHTITATTAPEETGWILFNDKWYFYLHGINNTYCGIHISTSTCKRLECWPILFIPLAAWGITNVVQCIVSPSATSGLQYFSTHDS